jgi:hypothetical protein
VASLGVQGQAIVGEDMKDLAFLHRLDEEKDDEDASSSSQLQQQQLIRGLAKR